MLLVIWLYLEIFQHGEGAFRRLAPAATGTGIQIPAALWAKSFASGFAQRFIGDRQDDLFLQRVPEFDHFALEENHADLIGRQLDSLGISLMDVFWNLL